MPIYVFWTAAVNNAEIADRLDAFAAVLELGDANPYTIRAYRRAAETVRHSAVGVAELVAAGRGRELRGIGPGIEARLRELVDTGQISPSSPSSSASSSPTSSASAATSG